MPISNRSLRPRRAKPVSASQIRSLRRRRRLEWIWFGLVVAGLGLTYTIVATVRFHAKHVAATAAESPVEQPPNEQPLDANLSARSTASVTPLRSLMHLAELDRSPGEATDEPEHFFPAFDLRNTDDPLTAGEAPSVPSGGWV